MGVLSWYVCPEVVSRSEGEEHTEYISGHGQDQYHGKPPVLMSSDGGDYHCHAQSHSRAYLGTVISQTSHKMSSAKQYKLSLLAYFWFLKDIELDLDMRILHV